MSDFVLEANIPNLLRCARNTDEASGFDLSGFVNSCGSYGCLVGNDMLALGIYRGLMIHPRDWATKEYGVSSVPYCTGPLSFLFYFFRRRDDSREAALRRLRKFIYYVLHKREMLYDERGCVRETARRSEGDHFICRAALEQATATA
jgi:hypothetical protein